MDKSKLSVLFLGLSIFFATALVLYWFFYLREPAPSREVTDDTEEVVQAGDDEVANIADEDYAQEPAPIKDAEGVKTTGDLAPAPSEEESPAQSREMDGHEKSQVKKDGSTGLAGNDPEEKEGDDAGRKPVNPPQGNTSSSPGFNNTYPDSLQALLQKGNKEELANFFNHLIRNIKYSSNNDVIVKSIYSQQALRQGLANADIYFVSNGDKTMIKVNQLIDKARSIRNDDYLVFDKESLKIKQNEVSGIEVGKVKAK